MHNSLWQKGPVCTHQDDEEDDINLMRQLLVELTTEPEGSLLRDLGTFLSPEIMAQETEPRVARGRRQETRR
jgi:hypothetical protein